MFTLLVSLPNGVALVGWNTCDWQHFKMRLTWVYTILKLWLANVWTNQSTRGSRYWPNLRLMKMNSCDIFYRPTPSIWRNSSWGREHCMLFKVCLHNIDNIQLNSCLHLKTNRVDSCGQIPWSCQQSGNDPWSGPADASIACQSSDAIRMLSCSSKPVGGHFGWAERQCAFNRCRVIMLRNIIDQLQMNFIWFNCSWGGCVVALCDSEEKSRIYIDELKERYYSGITVGDNNLDALVFPTSPQSGAKIILNEPWEWPICIYFCIWFTVQISRKFSHLLCALFSPLTKNHNFNNNLVIKERSCTYIYLCVSFINA